MVKQKNRKKAFKQKQKREEKVIDFNQFLDDDHWDSAVPFFTFSDSDEEMERIIPDYPEISNPDVLEQMKSFLDDEDMAEFEVNERLYHALQEKDDIRKVKLVKEILKEYPNHLESRLLLLQLTTSVIDVDYMKELKELHELAISAWKKTNYGPWYHSDAQSPLLALSFITEFYLREGFYSLAGEVVDFVCSKIDDAYPPAFIYLMMCVYNALFRYEDITEFYEMTLVEQWEDDGILVHLVIASLLQGNFEEAESLFADLVELNPEVLWVFDIPIWADLLSEVDGDAEQTLNKAEFIQMVLSPLQGFLLIRPFVTQQLTTLAENYQLKHQEEEIDSPQRRFEFFGSPCMKDIPIDRGRNLCDAGILSQEDLESHTEKEILAIPGIGPVTVKKLKANGVKFKG